MALRRCVQSDARQEGLGRRHDAHFVGPARPRTEHRTVPLLPGEQVRLTRNAVFADNLIYRLLGAPRG